MFETIIFYILGFFEQYTTQLFAAYLLFAFYFRRRPYFWLRMIPSGAFYLTLPYWLGYDALTVDGWFTLTFLLEFFLVGLLMFFCFHITWRQALFFAAASYAIQHCMENAYWFLLVFLRPERRVLIQLLGLAVRLLFLAAFWFLFARRLKGDEDGRFAVKDSSVVILSVITVLIVYVLSMYASHSPWRSNARYLYSISCCLFLLFFQLGLFEQGKKQEKTDTLRRMLALEHEQHRLSKENVELINMKCHDLKHQIAELRQMTDRDRLNERLREMEKLVMIYDSFIKTGNSALDIVLTEKNLYCEKYGIRVTGSIDGTAALFLAEEDIYSLFGNILDNAIEAVMQADADKRAVTLSVAGQNGFLVIHSDNYCVHKLQFRDGLPLTTKQDGNFHGFGMQSIRYTAEKYGGSANAKLEGNFFNLNVIIPQPREGRKKSAA